MDDAGGKPWWVEGYDELAIPASSSGISQSPTGEPASRATLRSRCTAPRLAVAGTLVSSVVAVLIANSASSDSRRRDQRQDRNPAILELTTATATALSVAQDLATGHVNMQAKPEEAARLIQVAYDSGRAPLLRDTQEVLSRLDAGGISEPGRARAVGYVTVLINAYDLAAEPALPGERRYAHDAALRAREVGQIRAYLEVWMPARQPSPKQWESVQKGKGAPVEEYGAFEENYGQLVDRVDAALDPLRQCLTNDFGGGCG